MCSVRIPLNSRKYPGLFAIIDEEDYELVSQHSWHPTPPRKGRNSVYAKAYTRGGRKVQRAILLHRFLMSAKPGEIVDHIDGDGLNNRRENLRLATPQQNVANMGLSVHNTSGFKGVIWSEASQKWIARLSYFGKGVHIGLFATAEEAATAYDQRALLLFGEFARTNASLGLIPLAPQRVVASHSNFPGVRQRQSGRWSAKIKRNGVQIGLGTYDTKEQAACAYEDGALSLWIQGEEIQERVKRSAINALARRVAEKGR